MDSRVRGNDTIYLGYSPFKLFTVGRSNNLLRRFFHAVRRDDRQAGVGQHFLADFFVGALHADDQRYLQRNGFGCSDNAFGDHVAAHDAAEDVDQDGFQAWVFQHDLEGFGDFLSRGAAAYVQEVGWLAAEQLDGVHGGHGQAGAVHQATDVAVQGDVSQVEFRCFNFSWIFFVQVAVSDDFWLTEQPVGVEVELGVQSDDLARTGQYQRVDFGQRRVSFPIGFVQALQVGACVDDGFG